MIGFHFTEHGVTARRRALESAEHGIREEAHGLLRAAGAILLRAAVFEAPQGETGNLRRSLRLGPVEAQPGDILSVSVYEDDLTKTDWGGGVHYGVFVQEGTRAHDIRPKRAKALRFQAGGQTRFAKSVRHPGTSPNPFMMRAARHVERLDPALVEGMARRVKARLER